MADGRGYRSPVQNLTACLFEKQGRQLFRTSKRCAKRNFKIMTQIIGKIDCFDETVETWPIYIERLDQYFAVNEIAEENFLAALLSLMGPKTYSLLRLSQNCHPLRHTEKFVNF